MGTSIDRNKPAQTIVVDYALHFFFGGGGGAIYL